ncbi:flagellar protein FlaG [Congregibacter brevis]|uniref:Flagellar protein FlaG n=1 Tax=Congregibacter brevis TaxID=3081201 RepID=A0ABZ0IDK5_9GAMM|nr:flagellar protein FlaG [Congregibacter sp. IMCC45268]
MTNPVNSTSPANTQTTATQVARQESQESVNVGRQSAAASGSSAPAPVVQEAPRQSAQALSEATRDISEYIQSVSRSLNISVDGDLGTTVIQVVDAETDELVRQIPAEEILQIARFLSDQQASAEASDSIRGLLIDQNG